VFVCLIVCDVGTSKRGDLGPSWFIATPKKWCTLRLRILLFGQGVNPLQHTQTHTNTHTHTHTHIYIYVYIYIYIYIILQADCGNKTSKAKLKDYKFISIFYNTLPQKLKF